MVQIISVSLPSPLAPLQSCLVMDPAGRFSCTDLLEHLYFEDFDWFTKELEVSLLALSVCANP